jgi:hypothetical protein
LCKKKFRYKILFKAPSPWQPPVFPGGCPRYFCEGGGLFRTQREGRPKSRIFFYYKSQVSSDQMGTPLKNPGEKISQKFRLHNPTILFHTESKMRGDN